MAETFVYPVAVSTKYSPRAIITRSWLQTTLEY
jgi:hypothetical protein